MPKGQSESVNRRWTDNTMAKRKKKKYDIQNVTNTTKDIETQTPLKPEMNTGAPER